MTSLNKNERDLHSKAIHLSQSHKALEAEIVRVLQEIDAKKLFKKLGQSSLFLYATKVLGFSESVAYSFISVARKAKEVPDLQRAVEAKEISVAKASRIVSALNQENAGSLIEFAVTHSTREAEIEAARMNPKAARPDHLKVVGAETFELKVNISKKALELLARAESILAQKGQAGRRGENLEAVLCDFVKRHDPVQKAERAIERASRKGQVTPSENSARSEFKYPSEASTTSEERKPLTAAEHHSVFARDKGRCAHVDANGERCNSDRWVEVHHIIPVSRGGSNSPGNLTTLCSFHHDLVHQLSLPLEDGQVNWLRSPRVEYRVRRG